MRMMPLVWVLSRLLLSTFDLQVPFSNLSLFSIGFLTVAGNHELPERRG